MSDRVHVSAGDLRHRITIEEPYQGTATEYGDRPQLWREIAVSVPADITNLGGSELWRAQQTHSESTVRVTIRYNGSVTTLHRFKTSEGWYLYPINITPDHKNRRMDIMCSQRETKTIT